MSSNHLLLRALLCVALLLPSASRAQECVTCSTAACPKAAEWLAPCAPAALRPKLRSCPTTDRLYYHHELNPDPRWARYSTGWWCVRTGLWLPPDVETASIDPEHLKCRLVVDMMSQGSRTDVLTSTEYVFGPNLEAERKLNDYYGGVSEMRIEGGRIFERNKWSGGAEAKIQAGAKGPVRFVDSYALGMFLQDLPLSKNAVFRFVGVDLMKYEARVVAEDEVGNRTCWKVDVARIGKDGSPHAKLRVWFDENDRTLVKYFEVRETSSGQQQEISELR